MKVTARVAMNQLLVSMLLISANSIKDSVKKQKEKSGILVITEIIP